MKAALLWTFLAIFASTAIVTLLGITGVFAVQDGYLRPLIMAVLVETAGALVVLFKRTDFFGDSSKTSPAQASICGYWWEFNRNDERFGVNIVRIWVVDGELRMKGAAFDPEGNKQATWRSLAAALRDDTLELNYLWRGDEIETDTAADQFGGFGQVIFDGVANVTPQSGSGWFARGVLASETTLHQCRTEMRRIDAIYEPVVGGDDDQPKGKLAMAAYAKWKGRAVPEQPVTV
jgi:hypothetical protein